MPESELQPDLEGLKRFVEAGDRAPPACFVGHRELIAQVDTKLEVIMGGVLSDSDLSGLTQLIQGAPGAGKTALLRETAGRWQAAARARLTAVPNKPAAGIPVPVMLDRDLLYDEGETVLAIVEAMVEVDGGLGDRWSTTPEEFRRTLSHNLKGALGAPGLSVGGQRGTALAPERIGFDTLRRLQPPSTWVRPVCLMVDEIQGVDPHAKDVLNKLHNSMRGLPVLTVLAGLCDSYDNLNNKEKVGLSRFGSEVIHDIGCLTPEEAGESVRGMLALFRVIRTPVDTDWWAGRIAEVSDDWPQHFHNGQRALAEGLLATAGRLADVDAAFVLGRARKLREESYGRRRSPEIRAARCLTAAVMQDVASGIGMAEVLNSIDRYSAPMKNGAPPPREWRLPKGKTAEDFLDHLVHRGALHYDLGEDLYRCPIPSLQSYLIAHGREVSPPAAPPPEEADDLPEPP